MKEKMRERKSELIYLGEHSTVIPAKIMMSAWTISHGAFRVWCILRYFGRRPDQKDRESFPGYERIAKMMGVSERQIQTYIKELEKVGLITITKRQSKIFMGVFNVYTMIDPEKWWNEIGKKLNKSQQKRRKEKYKNLLPEVE